MLSVTVLITDCKSVNLCVFCSLRSEKRKKHPQRVRQKRTWRPKGCCPGAWSARCEKWPPVPCPPTPLPTPSWQKHVRKKKRLSVKKKVTVALVILHFINQSLFIKEFKEKGGKKEVRLPFSPSLSIEYQPWDIITSPKWTIITSPNYSVANMGHPHLPWASNSDPGCCRRGRKWCHADVGRRPWCACRRWRSRDVDYDLVGPRTRRWSLRWQPHPPGTLGPTPLPPTHLMGQREGRFHLRINTLSIRSGKRDGESEIYSTPTPENDSSVTTWRSTP